MAPIVAAALVKAALPMIRLFARPGHARRRRRGAGGASARPCWTPAGGRSRPSTSPCSFFGRSPRTRLTTWTWSWPGCGARRLILELDGVGALRRGARHPCDLGRREADAPAGATRPPVRDRRTARRAEAGNARLAPACDIGLSAAARSLGRRALAASQQPAARRAVQDRVPSRSIPARLAAKDPATKSRDSTVWRARAAARDNWTFSTEPDAFRLELGRKSHK